MACISPVLWHVFHQHYGMYFTSIMACILPVLWHVFHQYYCKYFTFSLWLVCNYKLWISIMYPVKFAAIILMRKIWLTSESPWAVLVLSEKSMKDRHIGNMKHMSRNIYLYMTACLNLVWLTCINLVKHNIHCLHNLLPCIYIMCRQQIYIRNTD